ncbi:hypothetical protein BGZ63DRAFT_472458 [Mariannaea sp. PMI_226]|nr:hypothetical protein BGZ63DRAFT_472458 [Mariannaea sp. PMI_226]
MSEPQRPPTSESEEEVDDPAPGQVEPDGIVRRALLHGLSSDDAELFSRLAVRQLLELQIRKPGLYDEQRINRYRFDDKELEKWFGGNDGYQLKIENEFAKLSLKVPGTDLISGLCQHVELAVELGKHLGPKDIISLYSVSKTFNRVISDNLLSSIRTWINYQAPEAGNIFNFKYYQNALTYDPVGRSWEGKGAGVEHHFHLPPVRLTPGVRYLQLVLGRHRYCKDIIAIMARNGHRMPKTMYSTLLRLWFLNELATTRQRIGWLKNKEIWTEEHLYNAQFLFVKLLMHFNDPIYGPSSHSLLRVFLGQKGLFRLWQLLLCKKWRTLIEIMELTTWYDSRPTLGMMQSHTDEDGHMYGVPLATVGSGHREGWGAGNKHLMRPDELIPVEAVRRGLRLDEHIMDMLVWGYIDFETGENLVPTEEEMYISDSENALAHMDTRRHWRRKHVLKKRWNELSPKQKQSIIDEEQDDRLRALQFCGHEDDEPEDGE